MIKKRFVAVAAVVVEVVTVTAAGVDVTVFLRVPINVIFDTDNSAKEVNELLIVFN